VCDRAHDQGSRPRDGSYIKFDANAAVLINNQNEPVGTRIFGAVGRELRKRNFMKSCRLPRKSFEARGNPRDEPAHKTRRHVLVISGHNKGAAAGCWPSIPARGRRGRGDNLMKKHQKARSQTSRRHYRARGADPLSKLMLVEPGAKGRAARFGSRRRAGNKVRVLKLHGETKEITSDARRGVKSENHG